MKILDLAGEGANALFMLRGAFLWEDSVVHPETSVETTRAVTEELTREDFVEIYAFRVGRDDPPLDRESALAVLADERNWQPPGPEGAEVLYELALTDTGDTEYWRLRRRLESAQASA